MPMHRFSTIVLLALLFVITEGKADSYLTVDILSSPCDGAPVFQEYIQAELFEDDLVRDDFYGKELCDKGCHFHGDTDDGLFDSNQEWYIQFQYRCKGKDMQKVCIDLDKHDPNKYPGLHGEHIIKVDFKAKEFFIDRSTGKPIVKEC